MQLALLKYDLIRTLGWWIPTALVVWLLVLTTTAPIPNQDSWVLYLSPLAGLTTAWPLFSESSATLAYIMTRGVSRTRLFWHRWLLGICFLAVVAAVALALIALGPRWALHRAFEYNDAAFFPMIRADESQSFFELFQWSVPVFCLTSFLQVLRALLLPQRHSSLWRALRAAADFAVLLLGLYATVMVLMMLESSPYVARVAPAYALFQQAFDHGRLYLGLCALLATGCAAHIYRHIEIPA